MPVLGTDQDRIGLLGKPPAVKQFPSVKNRKAYTPPTRPGANAGMKRTSVVEHNCCEYLREFSKKFETVLMGYSGAGGKLIHEKNQEQKIS